MSYLNTQTGVYPLSEQDIRIQYPNTSFSYPFNPPEEYTYVFPAPLPTYSTVTEIVREAAPVLTNKGHWEQTWEILPKFQEYTDDAGITHSVADQVSSAIAFAEAQAQQQLISAYDTALLEYFDNIARSKRYDNRITCALRAGYVGPFQAEGIAFAQWMDSCNAQAYIILAECLAGTRQIPASPAEFIALLPVITWPE
jgi:hypothetical protein